MIYGANDSAARAIKNVISKTNTMEIKNSLISFDKIVDQSGHANSFSSFNSQDSTEYRLRYRRQRSVVKICLLNTCFTNRPVATKILN